MSETKFARGDKVFLANGTSARFVSDLGGGEAVVSLEVAGEYYDSLEPDVRDALITVDRIFKNPPVHEMYAEIVEARSELVSLLKQQQEARETIYEQEKAHRARNAVLSKCWDGLFILEAFLEKRITHIVIVTYGAAKIMTFEDGLAYREEYGCSKGLKLLSLFGKSNGVLEWQVNQYYDGSGSHTQIYPAISFEDAVAQCRQLFDAQMAEIATDARKVYCMGSWLEMASAHGWAIPEDLMQRYREGQVANATENVEKAKKQLAEFETALQKARGE